MSSEEFRWIMMMVMGTSMIVILITWVRTMEQDHHPRTSPKTLSRAHYGR
jgi:hypothetical protein